MLLSAVLLITVFVPITVNAEETETWTPDDAVSEAISAYVSTLGGVHPTPYRKGGRAIAWGCCAFVNEVWKNVFGYDTYDLQPETVNSYGRISDVYTFLEENNAKPGDILWSHGAGQHYVILHAWDRNGMWISDGCMGGTVCHNNEYMPYDYYGFYNGSCVMTLYRLPEKLYYAFLDNLPDDVSEDSWYAQAVAKALDKGYMSQDGTVFEPDSLVTYGSLFQSLYMLEGSPEVSDHFFSAYDGYWFNDAVNWAVEENLVNKAALDQFDPYAIVTREKLATILCRLKLDENSNAVNAEALTGYADYEDISDFATYFIQWAVDNGLINTVDGNILPLKEVTRGELAQILANWQKI